jgi:hypothetical protein
MVQVAVNGEVADRGVLLLQAFTPLGPLMVHVTVPCGAGALAGTETTAVKVSGCPYVGEGLTGCMAMVWRVFGMVCGGPVPDAAL